MTCSTGGSWSASWLGRSACLQHAVYLLGQPGWAVLSLWHRQNPLPRKISACSSTGCWIGLIRWCVGLTKPSLPPTAGIRACPWSRWRLVATPDGAGHLARGWAVPGGHPGWATLHMSPATVVRCGHPGQGVPPRCSQGLPIQVPCNYYPDDDPARQPEVKWRGANLLFANWLNYCVYQQTPYRLERSEGGDPTLPFR